MRKCLSFLTTVLLLTFAAFTQFATAQNNEYLQVVGNMTVKVVITGSPEMPDLWYSFDQSDWTQITEATTINKSKSYNWDPTPVCYFKGNNPQGFNKSATDYVSITITGGNPDLKGNVMSLIGGDNFSSLTTIPCDYCFYGLFCPNPPSGFSVLGTYHSTSSSTCLSHVKDMVLPAMELKPYCYAYMFAYNTGLYDSPVLPATVMQPWCYAHMFEYCMNNFCSQTAYNSGTRLPELPSQQLAEGCYAFMFNMCPSIYNGENDWYCLPAEELAPRCYEGMFGTYRNQYYRSFKSLEIMATSLQDRCGNDIRYCMRRMLNYNIMNQTAGQYGRGALNTRMYWTDWGNTDDTENAPTDGWFTGFLYSNCTFNYQKGLTPLTKVAKTNYANTTKSSLFPYSCTLKENEFTYLTFDCKTNGGTWEQNCTYNADLRRVVRSDYKAKTVPADPVKTACAFKGWYTAPTGGTKVEKATILNQTSAQTYYAQFDAPETVEIYMSEGVLDIPTYLYNQFTIEGENENYTVHLHFNTTIGVLQTDYSQNIDWQKSWIQPANGAQMKFSEVQAEVLYYGDAFKAAKLEATVKDLQDVEYHIVIFTNCGRNYGTFEDETYNNGKRHLEASWDGQKFSFGDNNHLEEIYLRGDNYLRYYHMQSNPYDVLHIQLQFFPDPTKPGKIPTGVYPINSTQADGTVLLGSLPFTYPRDEYEYLIYQQNAWQQNHGSFVFHDYTYGQYEIRSIGNWTLRSGYVEVVNVDETYYIHCYARADANCQTDNDVIEFTAGGTAENPLTPVSVTFAAQTEQGTALEGGVTVKLANTQNWDNSAVWQAGTYKFFEGNQLKVNASLTGYTFSHWLVDGYRIDGNAAYEYAVGNADAMVIAVFKDGENPENPENPEDPENPETPIVSADADVTVYQNVSKTTTKILYNLDMRQGKDGLWYKPTDMGYGIAWADRNVGAASATETGDYYNWSKTEPGPLPFSSTGYSGAGSLYVGFILPEANDVATVKMGNDWHIPTYSEWSVLLSNAVNVSNRLNNPDDGTLYINMPPTGYYDYYYNNGNVPVNPWLNATSSAFLWTSEVLELYGGELGKTNAGMATNAFDGNMELSAGYIHLAAPVRAIYTPPFVTYTLTIRVGSFEYRYICQQGQNVTVTAVATETGAEFVKWNEDGLTNATRTFTMDRNMTYTAIFTDKEEPETPSTSPDASVNVYQFASADTMKLVYDLSPRQGKDGLWYKPVDLGYGVAWADRNIGAGSAGSLGSYFRWGDPVAGTDFSSTHSRNLDVTGHKTYDRLTAAQDAAVVNMGSEWRMPDEEDFYQLKTRSLITNNNTFTNKYYPTESIILPGGGYKGTQLYDDGWQYYWSRQFGQHGANSCSEGGGYGKEEYNSFALVRTGYNEYFVQTMDKNDCYGNETYLGMQVRAMYAPPFVTYQLTISVEGQANYVYVCQAGQNVTVTANAANGYEFDKWKQDGNTEATRTFTVNSDLYYTATFKQKETPKAQITFLDENGGVLKKEDVEYGKTPYCDLPSKNDDAQYTYTYAWDKTIVPVDGPAEYRAVLTQTKKQYTLTWNFDGGTTVSTPDQYTHGTIDWGTPILKPAEPTKEGFDFAGWRDQKGGDIVVTEMPAYTLTYTAKWTKQEPKTGIVRFVDWDGRELQNETLNFGVMPEFKGEKPSRPADENGEYEFTGWTPTIAMVSGDATYTAVYRNKALTDFDLVDDKLEGDAWYGTLASLAGQTLNVRYVRNMEAGQWLMFSLPFDFNLLMNSGHPFSGNVYALDGVTNEDGYLNLNFLPVTVMMKANTPYVFYSSNAVENPVFENVTVAALAENPYTVDVPSGGTVTYYNTTARIKLHQNDPLQFYILNNRLYQSGKNVVWMRAFRGYFMLSELPQGVRPRLRIVLHGQTATAIELVESDYEPQETPSVIKYVQNGVLIIEKNGVRYNAQGARME